MTAEKSQRICHKIKHSNERLGTDISLVARDEDVMNKGKMKESASLITFTFWFKV